MTLIYRAVSVEAFRLPIPNKTWVVVARGEVTSSGWSAPHLSSQGEQDDYLLFDFEATPPGNGDVVLQAIMPTVAVGVVTPGRNIRGLIVRATSNSVLANTQVLSIDKTGTDEHDFLPYEIDQPAEIDAKDLDEDEAHSEIASAELIRPELRTLALTPGEICKNKTLLKVPLYPEVKVKGWKLYRRWRYNVTELHYCYPGRLDDSISQILTRCLPAAVIAAVAGFAAGGPAGAVAAFKTALERCATAEIATLIKVKVRNREVKGEWKRV